MDCKITINRKALALGPRLNLSHERCDELVSEYIAELSSTDEEGITGEVLAACKVSRNLNEFAFLVLGIGYAEGGSDSLNILFGGRQHETSANN